jgi:hypothetical protein
MPGDATGTFLGQRRKNRVVRLPCSDTHGQAQTSLGAAGYEAKNSLRK